jgi:hypothetical protein
VLKGDMTSETFQEFKESIEASDWHYGIAFQGMRPSFKSAEASFLKIKYPTSPGTVGYCANLTATLSSLYFDRAHFNGASLWFADEPFSGWEQAAGRVFIDRVRAGFGDLRPFAEVDVFRFLSDEIELLTAFVVMGTVLAWDVYVLSPSGDRIVFISHDELFGVIAKTAEVKEAIMSTITNEVLGVFPQ